MSFVIKWLLLLLCLPASSASTQAGSAYLYHNDPASSPVIEETPLQTYAISTAPKVVEFYSPYCGGCRAFKPRYIDFANKFRQLHPEVEFYAVSCVAHKDKCKESSIHGYPTIMAFPAGQANGVTVRRSTLNGSLDPSSVAKALQLKDKQPAQPEEEPDDSNDDESNQEENHGEKDDDGQDEQDGQDEEDETGDEVPAENGGEPQEGEEMDSTFATTQRHLPQTAGRFGNAEETEGDAENDDDKTDAETTSDAETSPELDAAYGGVPSSHREVGDGFGERSIGNYKRSYSSRAATRPVDGSGAERARLGNRDMDRWREVIEARKQRFKAEGFSRARSSFRSGGGDRLSESSHPEFPGITKSMRAHTPGTTEFDKRRQNILDQIQRANRSRIRVPGMRGSDLKLDPNELFRKKELPYRREARKPSFLQKQAERIPGINRMFKMSQDEALILDSSLSFISSLKFDVFSTESPLSDEEKEALKGWLDLLAVSLPPEWGLHAVIDDLLANFSMVSENHANLVKVLNRHPLPRRRWSPYCNASSGQTCGFWKLLHIMTVGVAEHRGGLNLINSGMVDSNTRTFSPADAADVVRDYVSRFLRCETCRNHFVKQYDNCDFRRCERLSIHTDNASPDDWKQLALWLWEVHNHVNVRVMKTHKRYKEKQLNGEDEIQALFPSIENCLVCFDDEGKWNEDSVFVFLEKTYWDAPDAKADRLLTFEKLPAQDASGGGVVWIMLAFAVGLFVALRRHIQTQSGVYKYIMKSSIAGVGSKLEDAIKGKKRTA